MAVKNILFLDSVHPNLNESLKSAGYQCDLFYDKSVEELKALLPNYFGAVVRSKFKLTKEVLSNCNNLKFIARVGAGMENIDVTYAESKGIKCLHAPEGNRTAVAEQAIAMLLSLFNNLNKAHNEVRKGIWLREENRGVELEGKTVGIIGYGNMGSAFAQRLKGFDCKVLVHDKYKTGFGNEYVTESALENIFENADVLSLHTPLTDETEYLINKNFINSFKKDLYIINTARGKCLNTADLVEGLRSGKVKGACIDVLEYEAVSFEKLEADKLPEAFQYLINSDKVILSPHIAGWTHESNFKMADVLVKKIIKLDDMII